jgi:hypothetical protein
LCTSQTLLQLSNPFPPTNITSSGRDQQDDPNAGSETSGNKDRDLKNDDSHANDRITLSALLTLKLRGIPKGHLPPLTLTSLLTLSPSALSLLHIPPDIQLLWFLAHRSNIPSHPLKKPTDQSLATTRAIFFYRLSETHQFQRYHDVARWNIAIFLALLTKPSKEMDGTSRTFAQAYLHAVLEAHETPTLFAQREAFVSIWKHGPLDLWGRFRSAEMKLLKRRIKALRAEWDEVVQVEAYRWGAGTGEYHALVGRFLGSLIPSQGQGLRRVEQTGEDAGEDALMDEGEKEEVWEGNELVAALRVPYLGDEEESTEVRQQGPPVVDTRLALQAASEVRAEEIMKMIQREFA